ncbi:MAG: efflux RND transporter periplasmic adaptor subunit [Rubrivivax sp.]
MKLKLLPWLLGLGCSAVLAAPPSVLGCLIEPDQVADLGSPVVGVLSAVRVDRGDRVKKGQHLATLNAGVEAAQVAVADLRATGDADVLAAQAAHEFALQKFRRTESLVARKYLSQQALEQARSEYEVAAQKVAQAREQQQVRSREAGLARAQLAQRSLLSPFDGVVVERYFQLGERVEEKPVFKLARIHPLRVEVVVPAERYGSIAAGQIARISPQLPGFAARMATVTRVDKVLDAASNSFRVRLTLPNADHALPAGLRCQADFGRPAPAAPLR